MACGTDGTNGTGGGRPAPNILLGRLLAADRALLEEHGREVTLAAGASVLAPGEPMDRVFFPRTALVGLEEEVRSGQRLEVAMVGREGMLGWDALLGGGRVQQGARIRLRPGTLLSVPVPALHRACARSTALHACLLRFVHVMLVQVSRAVASSLFDPLGQRLARWLLMCHDRVGGDVLPARHAEIADGMGVRRASVTDQLHILEGERLLRCTRGAIAVRDRAGLERAAGDAYGVAEAQYRALIAPFGKGQALH